MILHIRNNIVYDSNNHIAIILSSALITSYDTYEELLGKAQKGMEFYKKLSHNVNQLHTRLKGTCQVQEEERQQLLAKISKRE